MRFISILLLCPLLAFGQSISFEEQDVPVYLPAGWSMFGYSCMDSKDVAEAFSGFEDQIVIVKDGDGNPYLPEYGYNGLGPLQMHRGYQIKLTEAITDFQFCPFIVPVDTPFDCYVIDNDFAKFLSDYYPEIESLVVDSCLNTIAANNVYELNTDGIPHILNDMDGLQYFTNMRDMGLFLSDENLTSLPDLSSMKNLWDLQIGESDYLTSLPELSSLNNLMELSIWDNDAMTVIPDLSSLTNLMELDIWGNDALTVIPDLSSLTYLTELSISGDALKCVMGYPEHLTIEEHWPPVCSFGCMDSTACNYNPEADMTDGSCVAEQDDDCVACPYDNFIEYHPNAINWNADLCLIEIIKGCMDPTAYNFNDYDDDGQANSLTGNDKIDINTDDGSCEYVYGCIEQEADNYNTEATTDDGSCIYYGCTDPTAGNYDETANTDDGSCLIGGCMNATAENYNADAVVDDGSCVIYGCTVLTFPNYNSQATIDDFSCDKNSLDVYGCTDETTFTYQDFATIDNGTCIYRSPKVGDLAQGGIVFYVDETGQHGLVAAQEDLPGTYEWGCYSESVNGADGQAIGTGYQNTLDIVNQGCATENGGITATQAALDAEINGYSDWYIPSKDELVEMYSTIGNGGSQGNIGGFNNSNYLSSSEYSSSHAWGVYFGNGYANYEYGNKNYSSRVRVIRAFGYTLGCMDETACNYIPEANMADGSCEYPELGYDCEGNFTEYVVGMQAEGGIVFYIDSTGERGLVAALEDLGRYEWGCYGESVNGADGQAIGTGYQNTLDIVNQGCSTENGGITAAQAALDAEINGYSDWYIPSDDELKEIYYTIGNGGPEGNIGGFESYWYWSSSEINSNDAWNVSFDDGDSFNFNFKNFTLSVRPIRTFGYTQGCMDSTACNYNPEANMADGSCEYAEEGYDCEGNEITYQVGDLAQGGIVFYVDSTGEKGLVAALEDLTGSFDWGCYGESVNGTDGTFIGTGYQNTLDIVNQGCATENGGITAAQAALDAEINGYSDWYLPSYNELREMYNTIGNGGSEGNIGGFSNSWSFYWSSSVGNIGYAWVLNFDSGTSDSHGEFRADRVRVIRAFGYTLGCMDSTACNYNPEANMADGSCEYAAEGYDCLDNPNTCYLIEDQGFLDYLKNNNDFYDLPVIIDDCLDVNAASNYTSIDIYSSSYPIKSLDGLQYFTNIERVDINLNYTDSLISIPQLSTLTNLTYLNIDSNKILSIIPDLSSLKNLTNLTVVRNPNLFQIPDHSQLVDLDTLVFFGNGVKYDSQYLSNFTSLKALAVDDYSSQSQFFDTELYSNLEFYGIVNASGKEFTEELPKFKNLQFLTVAFNDSLASLPDFSGLSDMKHLNIVENNSLESLPNLSGLSNLNELIIVDNNSLESLPNLSGLSNLNELIIIDNDSLESLPDLSDLSNLKHLTIIENNSLKTLPDLSGLTGLEGIDIEGNNLLCVGGYPDHLTIQQDWLPVCE